MWYVLNAVDQLSRALKSSQEKTENEECDEVLHIKTQTELTVLQIKEEFKKLLQFLRDEEEASITALRKEEEQKSQKMKEKLDDTYSNIEKLKLFCLDEEQPVCVVCRDSEKHLSHRFRPINEVVSSYKEQLKTALKSLEEKLKHIENNKRDCDKTIQLIKTQAEGTEWQINKEFKKLHQFLRDEEEASITALRKDEEQKSQKMKEKLEEMNRQISALSDTIKDIKEKMMPHTSDASFLHRFNVTLER
ncbi:nuclear factor 7, brain-like [Cyprinus carpio]|uniref:Nuclear factor 7, brain-like n=1 Tax=Cyprinus carpio TaxID=7962 RepID=A0A9R0AFJ7_CYPCA|nr:nuclear factor 7, brain-like [Cyprinus carpio]